MSLDSAKSVLDMANFVAEVQTSLDSLPSRKFARGKASRHGAQRLAFACIFIVAKKYGLFADPEFEVRYADVDGAQRRGFIDVVIEEPNHFEGLLLACEIVTDKVLFKDLLKVRDAPVSERGKRLIIQLNPWEKYPVTQPKATCENLTDAEANDILIMKYRRKPRTLLERRKASEWAEEKRQLDAQKAVYSLKC